MLTEPRKNTPQLLILAYELAEKYHEGQTRRNGKSYFHAHVTQVAHIVACDYVRLCKDSASPVWGHMLPLVTMGAVLHDVVEDTDCTYKDLIDAGFPKIVVEMVRDVTKLPGENYFDFIMRVQESPNIGSKIIKLADLEHNMSDLEDGSQKAKYQFAHYILSK
tara:strand:+ start:67 stop:555 length:489 start_codon:yes stop_codon:yes gene_type:complete